METQEVQSAISLKRILVATDFSAASKVALHYAAALAERHGSKIYVTHVIPPVPRTFIPIQPAPPELDTDRTQAEVDLQNFASSGSLERIDHEALVERGPIQNVLSEQIRQHEIDLLVRRRLGHSDHAPRRSYNPRNGGQNDPPRHRFHPLSLGWHA
jgi:nucleotide-binding universal stress UspA family protein